MIEGTAKLSQLQPWLAPFVANVLQWLADTYGVRGKLYDVYRSPAEQERRFALGDTKAHAGESAHQYGLAFDFVVSQGEQSPQQRQLQAFWRAIGFTVIDWDPSHVEYPNWKSLVS